MLLSLVLAVHFNSSPPTDTAHYEKTHLKMLIMIIIKKMKKDVGLLMAYEKKGDVELTLSQKQQQKTTAEN